MSVSERALMESELEDIVEGEFSLPVILKSPTGETITTSKNNPSRLLTGMVLYDARKETAGADGNPIIVREMVVVLRRTSCPTALLNVPTNARWEIKIPLDPILSAPLGSYILEGSKAMEEGRTVGTVRFFPKKAKQS